MFSPRACLEGALWMLRSGARWRDLPPRFPSRSTVHRRFVVWIGDGTLDRAWKRLLCKLDRVGKIDWREGFADGAFAPAKKAEMQEGRYQRTSRMGWLGFRAAWQDEKLRDR
ncbi:MAG: transposase [Planctomycetota bacterium]